MLRELADAATRGGADTPLAAGAADPDARSSSVLPSPAVGVRWIPRRPQHTHSRRVSSTIAKPNSRSSTGARPAASR